jgi:hypothetical protein
MTSPIVGDTSVTLEARNSICASQLYAFSAQPWLKTTSHRKEADITVPATPPATASPEVGRTAVVKTALAAT